jgi:hypothetical protein
VLTLDRPTTAPRGDVRDADTTPTLNHYVRKDRITRSIVEGVAVRAACGERFVVTSQGGGRTDAPAAIVCPDCEALFERMAP